MTWSNHAAFRGFFAEIIIHIEIKYVLYHN